MEKKSTIIAGALLGGIGGAIGGAVGGGLGGKLAEALSLPDNVLVHAITAGLLAGAASLTVILIIWSCWKRLKKNEDNA